MKIYIFRFTDKGMNKRGAITAIIIIALVAVAAIGGGVVIYNLFNEDSIGEAPTGVPSDEGNIESSNLSESGIGESDIQSDNVNEFGEGSLDSSGGGGGDSISLEEVITSEEFFCKVKLPIGYKYLFSGGETTGWWLETQTEIYNKEVFTDDESIFDLKIYDKTTGNLKTYTNKPSIVGMDGECKTDVSDSDIDTLFFLVKPLLFGDGGEIDIYSNAVPRSYKGFRSDYPDYYSEIWGRGFTNPLIPGDTETRLTETTTISGYECSYTGGYDDCINQEYCVALSLSNQGVGQEFEILSISVSESEFRVPDGC